MACALWSKLLRVGATLSLWPFVGPTPISCIYPDDPWPTTLVNKPSDFRWGFPPLQLSLSITHITVFFCLRAP